MQPEQPLDRCVQGIRKGQPPALKSEDTGGHASPTRWGQGVSGQRSSQALTPPPSYRRASEVPGGEGGQVGLAQGTQACIGPGRWAAPSTRLGTEGKRTSVASLLPNGTSGKSPQPPGRRGGRREGRPRPRGGGRQRGPGLGWGDNSRGETWQRQRPPWPGRAPSGWGGGSSVSRLSARAGLSGLRLQVPHWSCLAPALTRRLTGSITPDRVSLRSHVPRQGHTARWPKITFPLPKKAVSASDRGLVTLARRSHPARCPGLRMAQRLERQRALEAKAGPVSPPLSGVWHRMLNTEGLPSDSAPPPASPGALPTGARSPPAQSRGAGGAGESCLAHLRHEVLNGGRTGLRGRGGPGRRVARQPPVLTAASRLLLLSEEPQVRIFALCCLLRRCGSGREQGTVSLGHVRSASPTRVAQSPEGENACSVSPAPGQANPAAQPGSLWPHWPTLWGRPGFPAPSVVLFPPRPRASCQSRAVAAGE